MSATQQKWTEIPEFEGREMPVSGEGCPADMGGSEPYVDHNRIAGYRADLEGLNDISCLAI